MQQVLVVLLALLMLQNCNAENNTDENLEISGLLDLFPKEQIKNIFEKHLKSDDEFKAALGVIRGAKWNEVLEKILDSQEFKDFDDMLAKVNISLLSGIRHLKGTIMSSNVDTVNKDVTPSLKAFMLDVESTKPLENLIAAFKNRPSPPGKPHLLADTEPIPDLVTIRWTKPISDGGSPISGYLVEHRRVGSPHWVRATPLAVTVAELTLSGLEPGWRYQFRVTAQNAVGYSNPSDVSEPITVTLQRSAVTAPKFTQELNDTTALENDKCEFVAHFLGQPAPKVCWFKDGFEIFSSRRIRILTEPDRSVLTIHQTSLSDEGEIKCTATNRAGHISCKSRLTVEAPPSIRLPRQYEEGLLFEIGEVIRFKVSVVGRPTPLVFWSHNGESLQNSERHEIDYSDKSLSLKIANAQRTDRGEYQIKAVNKLGEDSASFLVTVTDKPSPPGKARVIMTLGKSVTLSWGAPNDDGGCKIGNYIVEYYRMGWNVWLKAATSRQLTTILGDLIEGSEYKFRIKAESPYGISEPSEESEVVFIPDPKRGLIQPLRGRSQPKEVAPVPVQRKKARSQSSSRVEQEVQSTINSTISANFPKRPERTKIKTPSRTPEASPIVQRKENIRQNIFDRASIARDLAYGSPEIKITNDFDFSTQSSVSSDADVSRRSSIDDKVYTDAHKVYNVKIEPYKNDQQKSKSGSKVQKLSPSPEPQRKLSPSPEPKKKLIREHSATVSGSSEFMLVLYSDENVKDDSEIFEFNEHHIPPPLSLSAPELGVEPPQFYFLKNSASSSELLHERAMNRLYQAVEAEEVELEKRRKAAENRRHSFGLELPKILVNSKDEKNLVGLERKHSIRKKSFSGPSTQHHATWAQRRQSLKTAAELKDEELPKNLVKSPIYMDSKKDGPMQNFLVEEKTITSVLEKSDKNSKLHTQASFEKKAVTIAEEAAWLEEYEESLSESEVESSDSEAERFKFQVMTHGKKSNKSFNNEEDTYHPGMALQNLKDKSNQPFEILTKPKKLPDPNFVPKPILKKTDASPTTSPVVSPPSSPIRAQRSLSPRPDVILQRNRSKSLAVPFLPTLNSSSSNEDLSDPPKPRKRSFSLTSATGLFKSNPKESPKPERKLSDHSIKPPSFSNLPSISTVAQISGITAASIVIPKKLLEKQEDTEASKVVADHYGDIVKSFGQRRKSNPQILTDRDSLKKAAMEMKTGQNLSSKDSLSSKDNLSNDSGYQSSNRRGSNDYFSSAKIVENLKQTNVIQKSYDEAYQSGHRKGSFSQQYNSVNKLENITNLEKDNTQERRLFAAASVNNSSSNNKGEAQSLAKPRTSISVTPMTFGHSEFIDQPSKANTLPTSFKISSNTPVPSHTQISERSEISRSSRKSSQSPVGRRSVTPSKRSSSVTRKPVTSLSQDTSKKSTPSTNSIYRSASRSPNSRSTTLSVGRKPHLKEIMTQTSIGFESIAVGTRTPSPIEDVLRQEQLLAKAEVKVRNAVDYLTDLAMFAVACWLYLFHNELLAIPILVIMVYRQMKEEILKRIPLWVLKRLNKKK